jgi:hypothetical protein
MLCSCKFNAWETSLDPSDHSVANADGKFLYYECQCNLDVFQLFEQEDAYLFNFPQVLIASNLSGDLGFFYKERVDLPPL